jgi:hypothetical protein
VLVEPSRHLRWWLAGHKRILIVNRVLGRYCLIRHECSRLELLPLEHLLLHQELLLHGQLHLLHHLLLRIEWIGLEEAWLGGLLLGFFSCFLLLVDVGDVEGIKGRFFWFLL